MTRVSMNFDDDLLKKVDDYAKKLGVNRSACVSMLCSEYMEQKEALVTLQAIAKMQEKEMVAK